MANPADSPLLVVFPRGQLSHEDRAQMRAGGIVAVEADDPAQVQQLHLTAPLVNTRINGDVIVRAALKVIAEREPANGYSINGIRRAAHAFVRLLSESLEKEGS